MVRTNVSITPDKSKSGMKTTEAEDARFTWFSPVDEPNTRFRYAVIKEEGGIVSIQPGEARFKKGLEAMRWEAEKGGEGTKWLVVKTRPNRIDLQRAPS